MELSFRTSEAQRRQKLDEYHILDSPPEGAFDDLALLACRTCATPFAFVALLDEGRQWFKARVGLDVESFPRALSFCEGLPFEAGVVLQVADMAADPRFREHPLVQGPTGMRFYAGIALQSPDGVPLGTLCVLDRMPRRLDAGQEEALRVLGRQVMAQLELRRELHLRQEEGEARQRAERLTSRFFDLSPDLLCVLDPAGAFLRLNAAWEAAMGYSAGDLQGKPLTELVHPEDQDDSRERIRNLAGGRHLVLFENRCRHADDTWRQMAWSATTDTVDGWIYAMARDITEERRKQVELQALVKGLCDLQFAVNRSTIVDVADAEGRIIDVNERFTAISGYTREEVLGKDHRIFNSGLHPASFFQEMWETVGSGRVWHGEIQNRAKDGHAYWVDTTIVPMLDDRGLPGRFLVMRYDISQRKQVDELKSEFVSTVSHELRTPLTSISGSLGLLLGGVVGTLDGPAREMVQMAATNAQRLVRLVNDILDLDKMDSGKLSIHARHVSLMPLVRQSVAGLRGLRPTLETPFHVEAGVEDALVLVDEDRLVQVVINLLSNAANYSPPGEPVRVRVLRQEGLLRLEVEDRGPGIAPEFQGRLFQRFSQADASSARRQGGSGLGLSISKALIEKMGGRIGFESRPGLTVFHIELPEEVREGAGTQGRQP